MVVTDEESQIGFWKEDIRTASGRKDRRSMSPVSPVTSRLYMNNHVEQVSHSDRRQIKTTPVKVTNIEEPK